MKLARKLLLLGGQSADAVYSAAILAYAPLLFIDMKLSPKWQVSDGTVPVASNGDVLGRVDDLSGNANHFLAATSALKPTYRLSVINGYPVMRYTTDDAMLSALALPDALSMFLVVTNRTGVQGTFWSTEGSGSPIQRDASPNSQHWHNFSVTQITVAASINQSALLQYHFNYTSDNYAARVNAASQTSTTATTTPAGMMALGAKSGNGEFLEGDIAAILLFNSVQSESNRAAIEAIFKARYGLVF